MAARVQCGEGNSCDGGPGASLHSQSICLAAAVTRHDIEGRAALRIGDRALGLDHPTYIIGEVGSNHDRDLETAIRMVDIAADTGCDAVKFQTFTGPDIASSWSDEATRLPDQYRHLGSNLAEFYAAVALPDEFHEPLFEHAQAREIDFLSSPFSEAAIARLVALGVPALKIASFELVHHPLIREAALSGLPVLLSTGMATLGEAEAALEVVFDAGGTAALLHCGSSYPLEPKDANLRAIQTMAEAFGVVVGYSDHTTGITIPAAAVALGARIIEKHVTYDRSQLGPDHSFALEPAALGAMVTAIRETEAALGCGRKRRMPVEEEHADRGRRSVFVTSDIAAGDVIEEDHLTVLRPGSGLAPANLALVVGRRAKVDLFADTPLTWDDLLGPVEM